MRKITLILAFCAFSTFAFGQTDFGKFLENAGKSLQKNQQPQQQQQTLNRTAVWITAFSVKDFPKTQQDGSNWDQGTTVFGDQKYADVYLKVKDQNGNVLWQQNRETKKINVQGQFFYTFPAPVIVPLAQNQYFWIEVWDHENFGSDKKIGNLLFKIDTKQNFAFRGEGEAAFRGRDLGVNIQWK